MEYKFGTKEWAEHNHNILIGCSHACKYCYARFNAVHRYKYVPSDNQFINQVKLNQKALTKRPFKYGKGRIMFPTTHDILPEFINETVTYLKKWLQVGNEILIVSKPHYECIKRICDELTEYKDQIVFRFTIGSTSDKVLSFWEPHAPSYQERLKSLKYAFNKGFKTSVSMEPKLDKNTEKAVEEMLPYITDTIWIGNMNYIDKRVDTSDWKKEDYLFKKMVVEAQTQEFTEHLYETYKDNPKIKWKESIKRMLNLPDEEIG